MKVRGVLEALVVALAFVGPLAQGNAIVYDRFCVRNLGCDTDFQDMILGVSFEICFEDRKIEVPGLILDLINRILKRFFFS